jgi:hypothetical protein
MADVSEKLSLQPQGVKGYFFVSDHDAKIGILMFLTHRQIGFIIKAKQSLLFYQIFK